MQTRTKMVRAVWWRGGGGCSEFEDNNRIIGFGIYNM